MTAEGLRIEGYALGPYETNCYVVSSGDRAWIVDAGFGPAPVIDAVRRRGLTCEAIVLTHAHLDHIAGVREVREALGHVPIWIHSAEEAWLTDPDLNLSAFAGIPVTAPPADRSLQDGEVLELGASRWEVLHTPGHSPGGITLRCPDAAVALVGDALFAGSIGRTDFPGSDFATLERSIRTRLYTLPDQTRVLPGHGPETTIGRERASNPFVRAV